MNVDYSVIGSKIKRQRLSRRMTQENLAEALSVSVGYVSQVECGKTSINLDLLAKICTALECRMDELVSESASGCPGYLTDSFSEKFSQLSPRDKKAVLGLIDALLKEP